MPWKQTVDCRSADRVNLITLLCILSWCNVVTDGHSRQRLLLSPAIQSSQLERHSAPSHRGRLPVPPPSNVVPPAVRTSTSGGETASVGSPVTSRWTAASSSRTAPRTDSSVTRRTNKAKPAVDGRAGCYNEQSLLPVHGRHAAIVVQPSENELSDDGFAMCDFSDHITDNNRR